MMQDFSKKIVIVVDKNLESWQVLNTVAHISAYLGNKMKVKFGTGDFFETTNDEEIVKILSNKTDDEIEYLGIGIFGENEQVNKLTKMFSFWK